MHDDSVCEPDYLPHVLINAAEGFQRVACVLEYESGPEFFYVVSCHHNGTDYPAYDLPYDKTLIVAELGDNDYRRQLAFGAPD